MASPLTLASEWHQEAASGGEEGWEESGGKVGDVNRDGGIGPGATGASAIAVGAIASSGLLLAAMRSGPTPLSYVCWYFCWQKISYM